MAIAWLEGLGKLKRGKKKTKHQNKQTNPNPTTS
jgi:hypothetical protein